MKTKNIRMSPGMKWVFITMAAFSFLFSTGKIYGHYEPKPENFSQSFITFEEFGAKADGSDETMILQKAFQHAKQQKKGVRLFNGKTYKFSPSQPVDITGIPFIDGNGKFDLSGVGEAAGNPSQRSVFTINGKKELLQSAVQGVKAGSLTIQLQKKLDLNNGDVLFITSTEPLPNNKRKYNRKGQRAIVEAYNKGTGQLTIKDSFHFTISSAWFWKNTVKPHIRIGDSLSFVTKPMNLLSCFQIVYANATISGTYSNFALAAIYFRSSEGEVNKVNIDLLINANNGYSYGVAISDMSDVIVRNSDITGGRHTVCITSGGLWRANETGAATNEALGYPAIGKIEGGTFKGSYIDDVNENLGTLDSHGSAYFMSVKNCTVYGVISLGAKQGLVENCIIYTDKKRAFNIGSDVEAGSDWGDYLISKITVKTETNNAKSILFGKASINQLSLSQIRIEGNSDQTLIADFKDQPPGQVNIDHLELSKPVASPKLWFNKKSKVSLKGSSIKMKDIKLIER